MPISQTKVQIQKNFQNLQYDCVLNSFVNGAPFQVKWILDPLTLEVATDDQIIGVIAPMIRSSLTYHNIHHGNDDVKALADKMVKAMHTHVPVKKKLYGGKPVAVPEGWSPGSKDSKTGKINGKPVSELAKKLPGVGTKQKPPCECFNYEDANVDDWTIETCIIHLNDRHNGSNVEDVWSRERIADWLDELHNSGKVNLEFQPWDSEGKEENG